MRTCGRRTRADSPRPPSRVGSAQMRGVAAQQPVVHLARCGPRPRPSAPAPPRRRRRRAASSPPCRASRGPRRSASAPIPSARQAPALRRYLRWARMSGFFINVDTGRVATHAMLIEAGEASDREPPGLPWHPVQGPSDASTARLRGPAKTRRRPRARAWIGLLCIRYGDRQASLEQEGWEEVTVEEIRAALGGRREQLRGLPKPGIEGGLEARLGPRVRVSGRYHREPVMQSEA